MFFRNIVCKIEEIGIDLSCRNGGKRIEEMKDCRTKDVIWKLETNIDDCSGELLGYVMELLLDAGAKDAFYMPIYMKKNRPAYLLTVLCAQQDKETMERILFRETTTIGIRQTKMERTILPRKICTFSSSLGEAIVKVCSLEGETWVYPEFESIRKLAQEHHLPLKEVQKLIVREAEEKRIWEEEPHSRH